MRSNIRVGIAAAAAVVVALASGWFLVPPPRSDAARQVRIDWMYRGYHLLFPRVRGIGARELKQRLDRGDDVVLVDVRTPEERAVSTLPGAITLDELREGESVYRGRPVVTYCTVGARSGVAAGDLLSEGWQVENLAGSLLAWTHVGGDLVDDAGQPTRRVHVYGRRWNLVAKGYQPVLTDESGEVFGI